MSEQATAVLENPSAENSYTAHQLEAEQVAADALRKKLFYSERPQHLLPPPESNHLLPSGQQRLVH